MGWNTPVRNLERFLRQNRKDGIPVFGAEAYLNKPTTLGYDNWIQIKATNKNICFQKEALLNLVIKNLPSNFKKIIVCDHDIWFEKKDWIEDASRHLDYYDFIQPFSTCIWTGKDGKEVTRKASFLKEHNSIIGHPGFAIGFRRSSFEKIWFYPYCIVGGGDTIFAGSIIRKASSAPLRFKTFFDAYSVAGSNEWYRNVINQDFLCGFTNGVVYHEHHGERKKRKYQGRNNIVKNFDFSNIFINENGLVEFNENSQKTMLEIYNYLLERNEDS